MHSNFVTDGTGLILADEEKAKLCLFGKIQNCWLCQSPKTTLGLNLFLERRVKPYIFLTFLKIYLPWNKVQRSVDGFFSSHSQILLLPEGVLKFFPQSAGPFSKPQHWFCKKEGNGEMRKKVVICSSRRVGEGAERNNEGEISFHLFPCASCPKLICLEHPSHFHPNYKNVSAQV